MQDDTIKLIERQLEVYTNIHSTERKAIIDALKEGQVCKNRFEDILEQFTDYKDSRFDMHTQYAIYTNEDYLLKIVFDAERRYNVKKNAPNLYKQMWEELTDMILKMPGEIRGRDSISVVRYVMQKILERYRLDIATEKEVVVKKEELSGIDKAVCKAIKKFADTFFDILEKRLEQE